MARVVVAGDCDCAAATARRAADGLVREAAVRIARRLEGPGKRRIEGIVSLLLLLLLLFWR